LTDDDLSRQLSGAFRRASDDLSYDGPVPVAQRGPSPRWLAVPAVAAVATVVTVAASHQGAPAPQAAGSASPSASSAAPTGRPPKTVTAKIVVAGNVFDFVHAAGESVPPNDLYADLSIATVPADAKPVTSHVDGVKASVGTDPASGYSALYLQGPNYQHSDADASSAVDGGLLVLLSPTWTQEQLSQLVLENELDFAVPAVG